MGEVGTLAGIVGLGINVYLLYQVNRLNEAKQEEREFMQKVLNIDKLDYILTSAADTLRESEDVDVQLTEDIWRTQGQLEGALQAIEEIEDRDLNEAGEYHVQHFDYYEKGFLTEEIPKATEVVRIICFRNGRLNNYDVAEVLAEQIRSGTSVELYSMSPTLPDEVLGRAGKNLPNPTAQGEAIREEIKQNFLNIHSIMQSELTAEEMENFDYRFYEEFPKVHLVQIDDTLYMSVPHFTKGDLENAEYDGKELYPCMRVSVSSPVGQYAIANIDHLRENMCRHWQDCIDIDGDGEHTTPQGPKQSVNQ